ncbi:DEAD/DEAH box helicase family protein [Synechocystis sp. LKSZ1]|uniref:DEAD/DEAH box helicase family protein n=1 Tax=Synechocystis sp. LKSZ1 TaxID=3144951 RepID=UPI00336C26A4
MARSPTLTYDRGTLLLHPPPRGQAWIQFVTWDDRVEKFRLPAYRYRALVECLQAEQIEFIDQARAFSPLELIPSIERQPFPHQAEALKAWKKANRQGVVVLPTAAGKTFVAQLALQSTPRTTLVLVPTLDLMHQWYEQMTKLFPQTEVGLLGGGSSDRSPILISTYHSAAIHAESLGNRYALLIFDECHHLPSNFFRVIAEYSLAPYRLGLTATPERSDGSHQELDHLIGPVVYHKVVEDLAGGTLAEHRVVQIKVKLSTEERQRYDQAIQTRNDFLHQTKISLGSLSGWQQFVIVSAGSAQGRRAMLAHREAKEISLGTEGKLRVLAEILAEHQPEPILIFTNDNATVYCISQQFLIPALTHQTSVKERHEILSAFRAGQYCALVTSHVLNEGVDVPSVKIAVILSGTGSTREYVQRLGRILRKHPEGAKLALLYEVVAEDTSEEKTAQRRKQASYRPEGTVRQLELLPGQQVRPLRAAEGGDSYGWEEEE